MKKLLFAIFLTFLYSVSAYGQVPTNIPNTVIQVFPGAPTGACLSVMVATRQDTGAFYDCFGGAWTPVGGAGAGANSSLSNLSNPTAVNQSLIPGTTGLTLGTQANPWANVYMQNLTFPGLEVGFFCFPGTLPSPPTGYGGLGCIDANGQLNQYDIATSAWVPIPFTTPSLGEPLIGTSTSSGQSAQSVPQSFDVSVNSGSDWSLKTQATLTGLPTANSDAFVNAAGFTSTQTASVNPFANLGTGENAIYFQLPCRPINATSVASSNPAWVVLGNDVVLSGCGIGGNSVLNASTGFPTNTALISIGNGLGGVLPDGTRLENYRLNCGTIVGCSVFSGLNLQENSGLKHIVGIGGNLSSGAVDEVTTYGAHATYEDIALNKTGTGANAFTLAGLANKVSRLTCNNTGSLTGNDCVNLSTSTFESSEFLDNIHPEGFINGVEFGANVSGFVNGIDASGAATVDVVHIDAGGSTGGVVVEGIVDVGTSTNLVNDLSYATPRTFPSAQYSFGSHHYLALYTDGTVAVGGFNGESPVYSGNHTLNTNEYNVSFSATATATVSAGYVGQLWNVFNRGSGTVTLVCSSGTINGAASLSIPPNTGVSQVTSDGTNCWGNQFLSTAVSGVTASGFLASSGGTTPAITVANAQGTDTNLLTSGTVSGSSGVFLCTDALGGATTSGCPGTGTGTVNSANQYQSYFQLSSGSVATAAGNPNILTDAANDLIDETVPAAAVANSPDIEGCGVYEVTSGPTYGPDCWGWQTNVGGGVNGATTYQLLHLSGSSGGRTVQIGSPAQSETIQVHNTIEEVAQGNQLTISGGLNGTNASAYGGLGLTGASIVGGSSAGLAGTATLVGGNDASSSATSQAGNAQLAAGAATAGGIQGSAYIEESFTTAAALAATLEVVDMTTTADRVEAAILGSTVVVGVAQTVGGTGSQLYVITHGKSLVRFDGTPVIGDVACGPTAVTGTAGLAHDNGSTACALGTSLGVVTGQVSGSGSGATATVLLR